MTSSDGLSKCSEPDNKYTYSIDPNQKGDFSVMFDQTSKSVHFSFGIIIYLLQYLHYMDNFHIWFIIVLNWLLWHND